MLLAQIIQSISIGEVFLCISLISAHWHHPCDQEHCTQTTQNENANGTDNDNATLLHKMSWSLVNLVKNQKVT